MRRRFDLGFRMAPAGLTLGALVLFTLGSASVARAQTLSNTYFNAKVGTNGELSSLQLTGDAFPTNYVLNATNAPGQNTTDHEWVGELMFTYRLDGGAWTTALTNQSADVRAITTGTDSVTVTYQNSANAKGVKNFKLVETYALVNDYLSWQITVTNTSTQTMEMGDFGLPLPFNEYWNQANDVIYETRTVYHSFTGNNNSYITVERPSGVGPFILMTPDQTTGAGFEYMDNWVKSEHSGSAWAAGGGTPSWTNGLDVFYIHSNVIKSTNRGYLPNTSLTLAAGASQTYSFKFFNVASHADVENRLYSEGMIDVSVVPSMIVPTNMTAKIDLHTSQTINSLTAQYPSQTTITSLGTAATDHKIYQLSFSQLGQNNVTVSYGTGLTTTLQFYVIEPIATALQRHATFMVANQQWTSGDMKGLFDDWMMDTKAKRGAEGGSGWGDDWGWTHGEFLAEKNAQTPVASEVTALDTYLAAVWGRAIDPTSYIVQDWWCPVGTSATNIMNCYYDRAYAYPHAFNTFFSMYKIANLYPKLITYQQTADTYLLRAYDIIHTLYSGHGSTSTGYMGEQTLPDIAAALTAGGHTTEAAFVTSSINSLYSAFSASPYPYGSEYTFDNTGEEAVYMAAKQNNNTSVLSKVNAKTRACRGQEPVWYYYADPVTNNGENWWQFQYTAALAGSCMDDFVRTQSTTPEVDERLSYAAKIANINAINSGQIDSNAANLGTVAWTYQGMKGNVYVYSFEPANSTLHNDWRQMSGEADLGLFGAIRILSADVSVDPIFGLTGYGCNVTSSNGCYAITPTDGVFKRLNLITQKFHMDLDRDQYTGATVSTTNNYLGFTLQNQTTSMAHTTHLTITGLAAGTYNVLVGGASAGTATATAGKATVVALSIGTAATYTVQIGTGCGSSTGGAGGAGGTTGVGGTSGTGAGGATGAGGTTGGAGGTGTAGTTGTTGGAGTTGTGSAGATGATGSAGTSGGSGTAGATGAGTAGSKGSAGSPGSGGTSGTTGPDGGGETGGGSSGCSCETAGGTQPQGRSSGLFLLLGLALTLARRRRSKR
jgi:MYXO-CTERM domain-containing protein